MKTECDRSQHCSFYLVICAFGLLDSQNGQKISCSFVSARNELDSVDLNLSRVLRNKRRFSQHRCQRKSPKQKTLSWNMQTCVCVCVCVCVIWCSYWPAAVVTFQTDRGRKWSDVAHQIKPPADTRRSLHALRLDDLQSTDTGPAHYVFYLDDLRQT